MYLRHMLLKTRIFFIKFTFIPSTMSIVFVSFKHLELPISIKISVTIMQIVYICMTATSPNLSL